MNFDTLYYIRDYSGNYYKVDNNDQLVVADSEKNAMIFTYAQANRRLSAGKKMAFYYMEQIQEGAVEMEAADEEECEYTSTVKELTYDEVAEQVDKNAASYDLSEIDWEEYLEHFAYVAEGLKNYRDELSKKQSDMDQKICDILHYIELCETDDREAIDLIELLRVCRENRRDIMDELSRIEYFQSNLGTNANVDKAKQALKSIRGLETRKYTPRKYEELFENCTFRCRHTHVEDLKPVRTNADDDGTQFDKENTYESEGGEFTMTDDKRYTIYDGKDNDWLGFARQQVDFYRNAGQHMTNLRVDIAEIDDEIESILMETENANCNVAQGYKVFKRLKELRLERKSKTTELNCLYALTDYVDCDALADTFEANLSEIEDIMGISKPNDVTEIKAAADNCNEEIHIVEPVNDLVG